jgi:glycine C-acetyltransferase
VKERLTELLAEIRAQGNYRSLRTITPRSETKVAIDGKEYLNLCSNSYLSLQHHPLIIEAVRGVLDLYGSGTCSSRSVSGNIDLYPILEERVAAYKGYPKALIFSNGYLANIGIISTLTNRGDVIFSDALNHSSLIHSMRLSRARKVVYRHRDAGDLAAKLKREPAEGTRFIVTETVFSMDGDVAPLDSIYRLKKEYGACLIVDDAHGTGVFGERGSGVEERFGLKGRADIQMATFGKSLASFGAFVLADPVIIEFLVNRAKSFMYTTALPAACLAASLAALSLVEKDLSFKQRLWRNIDYMRAGLSSAGFDLKESDGPIVPLVIGPDTKAVEMQAMLMEQGLFLQAIRPPTVPSGTSRLRLTVLRGFSQEEMDYALQAIIKAGRVMGLI